MKQVAVEKEDSRTWMQNVVLNHIPKNAVRFNALYYVGETHYSAFGFQVDLQPQEGKVVDETEDYCLIKTGRINFFVCAKELMFSVPDVGDKVMVTPYSRKNFDGQRLDAPTTVVDGGVQIQSFTLGESISRLPLDKTLITSQYLRDLILQVEELPTGDGVRKFSQVFVDAGAKTVEYNDPSDEAIIDCPPSLTFAVNTNKHVGNISIIYDRAMDFYDLQLTNKNGELIRTIDNIDFSSLPAAVIDVIDDGRWKLAKVEVLKKAPGRKKAA